jgi:hypothetical protein
MKFLPISILRLNLNTFSRFFYLILILLFFHGISFSQDTSKYSSSPQLIKKIESITTKKQDSLNSYFKRLDLLQDRHVSSLNKFCDSIVSYKGDSLNSDRKKEIFIYTKSSVTSISGMIKEQKEEVKDISDYFDSEINRLKSVKYNKISEYLSALENIDLGFTDSLNSSKDDFSEYFADSVETLKEAITDFIDDMMEIKTASLLVNMEYNNAYSYHGKKIEGDQQVLNTTLTYSHPLGFRVTADYIALTKKLSSLGELELSVGYKYPVFENFDVRIDYTRLFYKTTSLKYSKIIADTGSNQILKHDPQNNLKLKIKYSIGSILDLGGSFDYSFTPGKDYEINLTLSHTFTFEEILFSHDIDMDPSLNLFYGSIYSFESSKNGSKATAKEGQIQQKFSGFAVFDYEFSLSVSYNIKQLSISINYSYDLLRNELKKQGGSNFSSITYGVSYRF